MSARPTIAAALVDLPPGAVRNPGAADAAYGAFTLRRLHDGAEVEERRGRRTRVARRLERMIERATEAAGLSREDLDGPATGLVSGSSYGCSSVMEEVRRQLASKGPRGVDPISFARATHSYPLSLNAIGFGMRGPCAAMVSSEAAGLEALLCAADWLRSNRCERVFVVAYEDFGDPVAAHIEASDRRGLVNEAMALILLETEDSLLARGRQPLAAVEGFGAFGRSATQEDMTASMQRACGTACRERVAVSLAASPAVHHLRDEERRAADAIGKGTSVAFKPALGDCLGASGLVELALLLENQAAAASSPLWLVSALDPRTGGVVAGVSMTATSRQEGAS